MPHPDRGEETLPSLREYAAAYRQPTDYFLSIVFHPDNRRIGERLRLEFKGGREVLVGRSLPGFESGAPLDDPYVSRRAISIRRERTALVLSRPAGASRCQVGGMELGDSLRIDAERLGRGVALLLAHSVVLLLHSDDAAAGDGELADCGLVGSSAAMRALRAGILRAAASDRDVLLRGETGTGKELVAAAIHRLGSRSSGPFVAVNMAAIPPGLAAASLFGSARGAYTGAAKARTGYFREADGGTLFLDEVGDTPEEVQPLLLRALQEREIQSVGGPLQRVDLRVISATDLPLDEPGKGFRTALRYRLGALEIEVPPLRARAADSGLLLWHFLHSAAAREGCIDLLPDAASEPRIIAGWASIFLALATYHWPGNVRQLSNFATQILLASQREPQIPPALRQLIQADSAQGPPPGGDSSAPEAERRPSLREVSDEQFDEVMLHCRFEIAAVADALGVTRQSVYRRVHSSSAYRLAAEVGQDELREALEHCAGDIRAVAEYLAVSESALRSRLRNERGPV